MSGTGTTPTRRAPSTAESIAPLLGGEERHALPRPDATGGQGAGDAALLVLGGLGGEELDGHRGRSPVARRVLPVSR